METFISHILRSVGDRRRGGRPHGRPITRGIASLSWAVAIAAALSFDVHASVGRAPALSDVDRATSSVRAAVLLDAANGEPLYLHRPDDQLSPASTVKLMLLLVAAEAIEDGRIALEDSLTASRRAFRTGGQQIYVAEGERFTLETVALATAVHSANDAAVMLAEGVFGSYARAVAIMNARASDLGLTLTRFHSPHGLPESWGHHGDRSSAMDLARLGRAAAANPLVLRWCQTSRTDVPDRSLTLLNSNELLGELAGADGLKTGFTQTARYCFVGSCTREGRRLVCAILGADSSRRRFDLAETLFEFGFHRTGPRTVVDAGEAVARRPLGALHGSGEVDGEVVLVAAGPLRVAIEPERIGEPTLHLAAPDTLPGSLAHGERAGELIAIVRNAVVGRIPVLVDRLMDLSGPAGSPIPVR